MGGRGEEAALLATRRTAAATAAARQCSARRHRSLHARPRPRPPDVAYSHRGRPHAPQPRGHGLDGGSPDARLSNRLDAAARKGGFGAATAPRPPRGSDAARDPARGREAPRALRRDLHARPASTRPACAASGLAAQRRLAASARPRPTNGPAPPRAGKARPHSATARLDDAVIVTSSGSRPDSAASPLLCRVTRADRGGPADPRAGARPPWRRWLMGLGVRVWKP